MGINLNFNVLNQKGAPALYEDLFSNRPAASYAGRIFLATDTGDLYRDTGTTWFQIATSGGATPGIDDVLAVGQLFSAQRDIDCNGYIFRINNYDNFDIVSPNLTLANFGSDALSLGDSFDVKDGTKLWIDTFTNEIYTKYLTRIDGLIIDFNTANYKLGDPNNSTNYIEIDASGANLFTYAGNGVIGIKQGNTVFGTAGTTLGFWGVVNSYEFVVSTNRTCITEYNTTNKNGFDLDFGNEVFLFGKLYNGTGNKEFCLEFDANAKTLFFYNTDQQNGIYFDFITNSYKLGDLATNQTFLQVIGSNNIIETYFNNLQYGFSADGTNKLTLLGDYNGNTNNTTISIDDTNTIITLYSNDEIYLNDNGTGNMISGTASGASGDHLVININGNQYKIALLNP